MDASILAAPSSTNNRDQARDPEMHQTKKGKQWYFGMKAHLGVDAQTGVAHTVVTAPANEHDVTRASEFLHGSEAQVWGDSGYQGVQKRTTIQESRRTASLPGSSALQAHQSPNGSRSRARRGTGHASPPTPQRENPLW